MSGLQARDPDFARRVRDSFARQSLMTTLGAALDEIAPGRAVVVCPSGPHILQQHGFLHGGTVASLADTAAGFASMSLMEPGFGILTVEFKINFLAPAMGERFVTVGEVLKPGRTLTVAQAEVFAERDGRRNAVALLTATMMRIEGRPGVVD